MVENGTWTSDDGGDGTEVSSGLWDAQQTAEDHGNGTYNSRGRMRMAQQRAQDGDGVT